MSNPLKEAYDRASLLNDISERETLLQDYQRTGRLDRDKAVRKIQELRLTCCAGNGSHVSKEPYAVRAGD